MAGLDTTFPPNTITVGGYRTADHTIIQASLYTARYPFELKRNSQAQEFNMGFYILHEQ
jgi:hypothetical protein